jgi:non-ribosomal peptide synthetase component F
MQATPSYWQVLINAGWNGSPRLRVLTGGEALTPTLADQLLERSREVWNAYGPTETTVYATLGRVHKGAPIVLGKPIANTQVFVLDHALQPLPFGVQGQICIAGAGLARGYLNRPELTDARFVSALPSLREVNIERLYLTGDLGHYTAQGELACSGRSDHQVKVMGQRIELDEIAVQVGAHPAVAGAVVVLNHDQGAPRLIAYLVQAPGSRLAHEALFQEVHAHLERVLTLAMLPSQYVVLERFPLTPSGKIDRKRLPAPAIVQAARAQHPLEGPTQHTLARCWERVLRIPVSDAKANFFQLGGSSLAAMQVAVEAAKQGVELVPDALFAYPTLEELSNAVELGWTRRDRYQNDPDWLSNPDDSGLPVAE